MSMTLTGLSQITLPTVSASGVVTLPTGLGLSSGNDYIILWSEGDASVTPGTQTATQFTCVLVSATAVPILVFKTPRGKTHID